LFGGILADVDLGTPFRGNQDAAGFIFTAGAAGVMSLAG